MEIYKTVIGVKVQLLKRGKLMKNQLSLLLLGAMFFHPISVLAHTGVSETTGLYSGLSHPIGGTDHFLAMVAVGLWAAQMGGKAIWAVPSAFVVLMIFGVALAISGIQVPYVEEGILVSMLTLGVFIAAAFKFPLTTSATIVGFFALFHGYAHGNEMSLAIGAISYSIGFALGTALLHVSITCNGDSWRNYSTKNEH
jgi:urease accessory protein